MFSCVKKWEEIVRELSVLGLTVLQRKGVRFLFENKLK
jgi:hypothetical protein